MQLDSDPAATRSQYVGFFPPGFQHQQNPPDRRGSASPCHCYVFPRDQSYHHSPLPLGESQQTDEMLHWEQLSQVKTTNKQTNQPKRLKEAEAIRSNAGIERLVSWLQIQSTKHLICWIICSKLRDRAQHCPSALPEAPHSCVFSWYLRVIENYGP